jgi:hypothetical protein
MRILSLTAKYSILLRSIGWKKGARKMDAHNEILTGMVDVNGQRVEYSTPLTKDELNALETLLGKFQKTRRSMVDQWKVTEIRMQVVEYAEGKE